MAQQPQPRLTFNKVKVASAYLLFTMTWGLQLTKLKVNRYNLNSDQSKTTMIPKRFETIVFAFFMSLIMSFLMSGVVTLINLGIVDHFVMLWFKAFSKAFVLAFPCVLLIVPLVRKIVGKLVE